MFGSELAELIHYPSSPVPPGYTLRLDHDAPIKPAFSKVLALLGLDRSSLLRVQVG
jgi:hypothetical protein